MVAILILTGAVIDGRGQTTSQSAQSQTQGNSLPAPTPYAVTKQDGDSRVWERTIYEPGPKGLTTAGFDPTSRITQLSGAGTLIEGAAKPSK